MNKDIIEQVLHEIDEYFDNSSNTLRGANNLIQSIYEKLSSEIEGNSWQPDWSRIPDHISNEVVAWQIDFNHQPVWVLEDGSNFQAPFFGYVGSRQHSRHERF